MLTHLLFKNTEDASVSNKQEGPARCWLTCCLKSEHALVSNKQEAPGRSWLTHCSEPRACSCQWQSGWASQILTYMLFNTQRTLLSATSRKGQPDPDLHTIQNAQLSATTRKSQPDSDLHTIQNPEHDLVSNKQEEPARSWHTRYSNSTAGSFQQQAGRASQILTYSLFKIQRWSCWQQAGRASQILTYILLKTQSMLLSATSNKGQLNADLHPIQNPEHDLVSNKQKGPARSWLTACSNPKGWSCQQQAGRASHWMLTYILFKTQRMLSSATSRMGQADPNLHPV